MLEHKQRCLFKIEQINENYSLPDNKKVIDEIILSF